MTPPFSPLTPSASHFTPHSPRILLTGCAGFIGWKVCEYLLSAGYEVVGVDKDPEKLKLLQQGRALSTRMASRSSWSKRGVGSASPTRWVQP